MRRSIKYGLYGAVLAGVLGGSLAWASVDKTVTLTVDGQVTHVHTVGSDVHDVLESQGYTVGAHDLVAPAPTAAVHDGSAIVLKRGRLLHLSVDGQERDVWVTDSTVTQALADLGYNTSSFTSVSRSKRLPLTPTDIDVRTPKQVTMVMAGRPTFITTTATTVGDLLKNLGITVAPVDRLTPAATTPITVGLKIQIQRVTQGKVVQQQPIPYTITKENDPTMPQGTTKVVTAGKNGVSQVTYAVIYVDGAPAGKTEIGSTVVTPPTNEVDKVGTMVPAPVVQAPTTGGGNTGGGNASAPAPVVTNVTPGSAQAIGQQMVTAHGWGADQFDCLVQMWDRESGWRVNAANPSGAYGIPQALPGSKMSAFGADWQTNPATQIAWGLSYIQGRYGTPCGAWAFWQQGDWY